MAQTRLITDLVELVKPNSDDVLVIVDNTSDPSLSVTKKIKYSSLVEDLQDMVDVLFAEGNGITLTYVDSGNTITIAVSGDTTTQRSIYSSGGTTIGTRQQLNFIPGAGITLSGVDNAGSNRVDLTIRSTGVSTATNLVASGQSISILPSIVTLGDGTKDLQLRPIEAGSNKLTVSSGSGGNSVLLDVNPSNIDINSLSVGSPLAVALGGTNATTATDARSNLGAAKAGANSDITSLSGLTTALSIGQGGTAGTTAQAGLRNLLGLNNVANVATAGESIVANSSTLVAGSYRAELRGIKAGSNKVSVGIVSNDVSIDVDPDAVLGGATQDANFNSYKITNLGAPISSTDAATKSYVDTVAQGLGPKGAVVFATTTGQTGTYSAGAKTFTYTATGITTIDGVQVTVSGTRVLFKNQATASQNGIYTLTTVGGAGVSAVFTRATDYDTSGEVGPGTFTYVTSGATNAGKQFVQTTSAPTLDTSSLVFELLSDSTIADGSITNAKLANMSALRIKGTVTSGEPQDLTPDQVTQIVNSGTTVIALSRLATGALPSGITIDSSNITNGSIVDADINASAAIADSKLATISTAGKVSGSAITSGTISGSTAMSISGAIATTSGISGNNVVASGSLAVGQASAAANTDLDLAGTYAQTVVAVGALNIDCSTGNYFTKTISGDSTFTVSNVPASRAYAFTLELTHTSGAITWFSGVEWPGGTAPTLTTGKTHLFIFVTDDSGTRWRASSLTNYTN